MSRFMGNRNLWFILLLILGLSVLAAGCGRSQKSGEGETPPVEEPSPPVSESTPVKLTLYFPTPDGGLGLEERTVQSTDQDMVKTVFNELLNPTSEENRVIPSGTRLISSETKDGDIRINLSHEFRDNFKGGSTAEELILYSLVNSLTSLDGVESVSFYIEGEKADIALRSLDTSMPLTFNEAIVE